MRPTPDLDGGRMEVAMIAEERINVMARYFVLSATPKTKYVIADEAAFKVLKITQMGLD